MPTKLLKLYELPANAGFFLVCSFTFTAVFTVDNSPRYFVASLDDDGDETYSNSYDTLEEAERFCAAVPGCYVVLRAPLDFSGKGQRVSST